jgi:transcriptional regulator with XRE-family HTH domain
MTSNYTKISKLSAAFRDARVAKGLDLGEMAAELGIQKHIMETLEASDWSDIPPDKAYDIAVLIANRLGISLDKFYVDRAFFFGDLEERENRPGEQRRERLVLIAMTTATVAMLAWLLIPAKGISQAATAENQNSSEQGAVWQKTATDLPYPVLGEMLPETPITSEGVLISLRATDTCTAGIITEKGELSQPLRMSDPWKLRVKGAFDLRLDNAGVVAIEVAGSKIHHGAGVGERWSGTFDAQGNWQAPPRPPIPPKPRPLPVEEPDGDAHSGPER